MKEYPIADYPVRVVHEPTQQGPRTSDLYQGSYIVLLNHIVDVVFVPDVGAVAPPWRFDLLPADLDDVATPEQARLCMARSGSCVVTPNEAHAGRVERLERSSSDVYGSPPTSSVVFYVTGSEF